MSNLAMMMGLGSAAGGTVSVADVFSTDLYTGTSSLQTITNGVDLSSNGGFVWTKSRTATAGDSHYVFDTERGASAALFTNLANGQSTASGEGVVAFNSDGFDVNGSSRSNTSGVSYVSWTWRKSPKFFDVVTWTGDDTDNRAIPHNLGTTVGCYFVKCISHSTASDWIVWHKDLSGNSYDLVLNTTAAEANYNLFSTTAPDSSNIYLGTGYKDYHNTSGRTYVAYIFAHNEDLIQCGSFNGDPSGSLDVALGFQPQFIIVKTKNAAGNFTIFDAERGAGKYLVTDGSTAEGTDASPDITFTASGFTASGNFGIDGRSYIYMAIKAEG